MIKSAMDFFQTAGKNLAAAEAAAGIRHHVALSVVGTERLQDSGYFRAKLAQERLIKSSGIPYTIVHATQFFEFLRGIAQSAVAGDAVHLPHALVSADGGRRRRDARLRQAALAQPVNGTVEIAGPEPSTWMRSSARSSPTTRSPLTVVRDPEALYFGVKLNDQSLVPGPSRAPWRNQVRLVAHPRPAAEAVIAALADAGQCVRLLRSTPC